MLLVLTVLARTSSTMWNRSGENQHLSIIPDFREESIQSFAIVCDVICKLRKCSYFCCAESSVMNGSWILSKLFFIHCDDCIDFSPSLNFILNFMYPWEFYLSLHCLDFAGLCSWIIEACLLWCLWFWKVCNNWIPHKINGDVLLPLFSGRVSVGWVLFPL